MAAGGFDLAGYQTGYHCSLLQGCIPTTPPATSQKPWRDLSQESWMLSRQTPKRKVRIPVKTLHSNNLLSAVAFFVKSLVTLGCLCVCACVEDDSDSFGRTINVAEGSRLNIYILLDTSGSIKEKDFDRSKEATIALIRKVRSKVNNTVSHLAIFTQTVPTMSSSSS